uniref:PH domain-containing protein n=1 Tax=Meloidogyne hapla TaxID=6305 RepID=A0A1I8B089_MELHA
MEAAENYDASKPRKSVVQIILPTNKSENSTTNFSNDNYLNEWIEATKKKINLLITRIYRRRSRRGSNISAVRKQTMREKYTIALTIEWSVNNWEWADLLLVIVFATQIPVQIWAIAIVKGCYDFYVLLHVFVTLATK